MKKLLFIATNPWTAWGGSEKLWVYTAAHLVKTKKIKAGVFINRWESLEPAIKELLGVSAQFTYSFRRSTFERLLGRISTHYRPEAVDARLFAAAVKSLKPDLVVISQGANYDGLQWMEFCASSKVPFVSISQAATEYVWLGQDEGERLGEVLSGSARNYFVSKDNLRLTELQIGRPLPNSAVVANPFDVPYDCQLAFPSTESGFRLACVARLELFSKGQDVLLETLSDPKWKARNLSVGFYGKGRDNWLVEKLIKRFSLEKSVHTMGYVPPVEIWKNSHALVLPSRYEGLPLALVEAMMCGRFGIITNVSGNPEVIVDNVNGFLAEAPKAVYLDRALERAWEKRDQWEPIGERARSFIKERIPADPVAQFADELLARV